MFWYGVVCGLRRRKEASRLSGIVVANEWRTDPNLGESCPYCLWKTVRARIPSRRQHPGYLTRDSIIHKLLRYLIPSGARKLHQVEGVNLP